MSSPVQTFQAKNALGAPLVVAEQVRALQMKLSAPAMPVGGVGQALGFPNGGELGVALLGMHVRVHDDPTLRALQTQPWGLTDGRQILLDVQFLLPDTPAAKRWLETAPDLRWLGEMLNPTSDKLHCLPALEAAVRAAYAADPAQGYVSPDKVMATLATQVAPDILAEEGLPTKPEKIDRYQQAVARDRALAPAYWESLRTGLPIESGMQELLSSNLRYLPEATEQGRESLKALQMQAMRDWLNPANPTNPTLPEVSPLETAIGLQAAASLIAGRAVAQSLGEWVKVQGNTLKKINAVGGAEAAAGCGSAERFLRYLAQAGLQKSDKALAQDAKDRNQAVVEFARAVAEAGEGALLNKEEIKRMIDFLSGFEHVSVTSVLRATKALNPAPVKAPGFKP